MAQNLLDILEVNGKIIIYNKNSTRQFTPNIPEKFNVYGFGKLDTKQIITDKIKSYDFSFWCDETELTLKMDVSNGNKTENFEIVCPEIFPDIDINETNLDNDELKKLINILRNKVKNLTYKLELQKQYYESEIERNRYEFERNKYGGEYWFWCG